MIPKTETPKSSNIAHFSHEGETLTIQFKNGFVYEHYGVPDDIAKNLLTNHQQGGSVGSHYHSYIKGKFETKRVA